MDQTFNNNPSSFENIIPQPLGTDKSLLSIPPENNEFEESFRHRHSSSSSIPLVHLPKVGKKKASVSVHRLTKRLRKRLHRLESANNEQNDQNKVSPDEIDTVSSESEVEDLVEEIPQKNFDYIITNDYTTSPTSTVIPSSLSPPKNPPRPSLSPLLGPLHSTTGSGSERGGSERGSYKFFRKLKRISTVGSISPGLTPLPSPAFAPADIRTYGDASTVAAPTLRDSLKDSFSSSSSSIHFSTDQLSASASSIFRPRSRNRDRDRNIEYHYGASLKAHTPRKRGTPSLTRGLRKRRTISTQQQSLFSSQSNTTSWTGTTHDILPSHYRTLTSKSDPNISSALKFRPLYADRDFVFLQIDPVIFARNRRSRSIVQPRAIISLLFIRVVGREVLLCFLPRHPFISNFLSRDLTTVLEPPDDAQWVRFGLIEDLQLSYTLDSEDMLIMDRADGGDILANTMALSQSQNSNSFPRTSRSRSRSPSMPMLSPTRMPLLSPKKASLPANVSLLLKAQSPQQSHDFFKFISEMSSFNKKERKRGLVIEFSNITDFKERRKGEKDEKTELAPVKEDDMEIEMDAHGIIHELKSSVHDHIKRIAFLMENIDSKTQFVHEHIILLRELEDTVNDLTDRTRFAIARTLPPLVEQIASASVSELSEKLHNTQGLIRRKVDVFNHGQSLLERLKDNVAVQAQGRRVRWEWVLAIFFISLAVTIWITYKFFWRLKASGELL